MQRLGIIRDSGHEHFGNCVIVPVISEDGEVKEIYGRKISVRSENSGNVRHLYLPSREDRGVFNIAAFKASKDLVLQTSYRPSIHDCSLNRSGRARGSSGIMSFQLVHSPRSLAIAVSS